MINLKNILNEIPAIPGIYKFKNSSKEIIYIGKALKLKSRVQSYFRENATLNSAKIAMIKEIVDIEIIPCESEIEALILESNLIKKYNPKYNVLLKDDKSYAYLAWTKEKFPRLFITYKSFLDKHTDKINFLGPFVSAESLRTSLRIIRKIFPYRSCKTLPKHPCLYYKLNLCQAPCVDKITESEYLENLQKIIDFMRGKKKSIIDKLSNEMILHSDKLDFEKAGKIRDQLIAIEKIALHKNVIKRSKVKKITYLEELKTKLNLDKLPNRIEGFDSSHFHGDKAVVSMVVFVGGKPDKSEYRRFKIKNPPDGGDDFYNLYQALTRRFNRKDWPIPDLILIDGGKGQLGMAIEAQKNGLIQYKSIPIISLAKRLEEVYLPNQKYPVIIPKNSKALQILQQVRDESHRFAVTYHRKLRDKL